eukprot:5524375-Prymnesium_polylepis.1
MTLPSESSSPTPSSQPSILQVSFIEVLYPGKCNSTLRLCTFLRARLAARAEEVDQPGGLCGTRRQIANGA